MWLDTCRVARRNARKASGGGGYFSSLLPNNLRETILKRKNLFGLWFQPDMAEIVLQLEQIIVVGQRERRGRG